MLGIPVGYTDLPDLAAKPRASMSGNTLSVVAFRPILHRLTALLDGTPMHGPEPIRRVDLGDLLDADDVGPAAAQPTVATLRGVLVQAMRVDRPQVARSIAVAAARAANGPDADQDPESMSAAILALAGAATSAAGMAGRGLAQRSGIEPDHGATVASDRGTEIGAYAALRVEISGSSGDFGEECVGCGAKPCSNSETARRSRK
jgi:hypothetical protein